MKKYFILVILCFICTMGFSQKTFVSENYCVETVDEFGDKTGNIRVGILAAGYFSNSATINSNARLNIFKGTTSTGKPYLTATLYEYNKYPSRHTFGITLKGTTTNDSFDGTDYRINIEKFIKLATENDTILVKMRGLGYSNTTAVFKLCDCKEFVKLYNNPVITE